MYSGARTLSHVHSKMCHIHTHTHIVLYHCRCFVAALFVFCEIRKNVNRASMTVSDHDYFGEFSYVIHAAGHFNSQTENIVLLFRSCGTAYRVCMCGSDACTLYAVDTDNGKHQR